MESATPSIGEFVMEINGLDPRPMKWNLSITRE